MFVDCGHCRSCRLKRRAEWSLRMKHETSTSGGLALFIMLSYDGDHLPKGGTLVKKDLQDFFKRLRINLQRDGDNSKFKYYACGEYGPQTCRPHYHLIIIGLSMRHADLIFKSWGKCQSVGFGCKLISTADEKAFSYVSGYTCKKLGKHYNSNFRDNTGKQPEFQLNSSGLGKKYAQTIELFNGLMRENGTWRVPPRYYRKILGLCADLYKNVIALRDEQVLDFVLNAYASSGLAKKIRSAIAPLKHWLFIPLMDKVRVECDERLKKRELNWRVNAV
ncbi:MAG: hypothetical protein FWB85_05200 [Chitinispirillia bacterium]|nr:hypothetical protein [Chitinispirillia bacterium]